QTQETKVDIGKALDAGLVVTESSRTEYGKQDTSCRPGNDINDVDAYIRLIYDEESMAEEEQTLDLIAGTPFNLKEERIKALIKENVMSGRPKLGTFKNIRDNVQFKCGGKQALETIPSTAFALFLK
ncbi:hypothetical protein Tco_1241068, partial [Tanacetum coccineum]